MSSVFISPPPDDWDSWVLSQEENGGFCQTISRANIVHSQKNARSIVYDVIGENGYLVAGALLSIITPPGLFRSRKIMLCAEGPVLSETATPHDLNKILDQIDAAAIENKIKKVVFSGFPPKSSAINNENMHDQFIDKGYKATAWSTFIIDLRKNEDEIFNKFHRSIRKGIRKCEKENLVVYKSKTEKDFSRFLHHTKKIKPGNHLPKNMKRWWDIDQGKNYDFFTVQSPDQEVLATLGVYRHGKMATEIMSVRTQRGIDIGLPAQDYLHWEILKTLKAGGIHFFNLAGHNPAPSNSKETGIKSFKEKWGGDPVNFNIYKKEF